MWLWVVAGVGVGTVVGFTMGPGKVSLFQVQIHTAHRNSTYKRIAQILKTYQIYQVTGRLTLLYAFVDTVTLLEKVVMVSLATAVEEVFALPCLSVIVPAWEGTFAGPDDRGGSAGIWGRWEGGRVGARRVVCE